MWCARARGEADRAPVAAGDPRPEGSGDGRRRRADRFRGTGGGPRGAEAGAPALSIGVAGLALGYVATQDPRSQLDGIPSFPYFMFGTVGVLAMIGDVRMIRAGGVKGPTRIARHLWRMSFALFVAAMSFFLGRADEFPKALRVLPVMAGPPLAVLVTMLYWMWRVRFRRAMPCGSSAHADLPDHPMLDV